MHVNSKIWFCSNISVSVVTLLYMSGRVGLVAFRLETFPPDSTHWDSSGSVVRNGNGSG